MPVPEVVMRRWFDEVWNQRRDQAIDDLMAFDAVAHGLGSEPLRGTAAFKPFFRAFLQAFPDLHIDVVRSIEAGDLVVTHIHATGHHTGEGIGGAPTGRPVAFQGMVIAQVQGGQIVQGWNCIDFLTMYQQIGWVSSPVVP
jgi:predicted ester cyclase